MKHMTLRLSAAVLSAIPIFIAAWESGGDSNPTGDSSTGGVDGASGSPSGGNSGGGLAGSANGGGGAGNGSDASNTTDGSPGNASGVPVIPVGLDAYRMWDHLPDVRIGQRAYMRSTYD